MPQHGAGSGIHAPNLASPSKSAGRNAFEPETTQNVQQSFSGSAVGACIDPVRGTPQPWCELNIESLPRDMQYAHVAWASECWSCGQHACIANGTMQQACRQSDPLSAESLAGRASHSQRARTSPGSAETCPLEGVPSGITQRDRDFIQTQEEFECMRAFVDGGRGVDGLARP